MAAPSRTVLLPVDETEQSKKAVESKRSRQLGDMGDEGFDEGYCTHLYQEGDTALFLNVYVLPEMFDTHIPWPAVKDLSENWSYYKYIKEKEADELLKKYENKCKENCFSSKVEKIPLSFEDAGKIGEQICEFSKEHKADIIVMNHHGEKTDSKGLGSTCSYCVSNAGVPVCVLYLP